MHLDRDGCYIAEEWTTPSISGKLAIEIELAVKRQFNHNPDIKIIGFKRENTHIDNYEAVKALINKMIEDSHMH